MADDRIDRAKYCSREYRVYLEVRRGVDLEAVPVGRGARLLSIVLAALLPVSLHFSGYFFASDLWFPWVAL